MKTGPARAFTLIELLVVIIIIAIVVAIVVPSLGGARNAARSASTQGLMTSINQAASKFEQDKRRLPGYFTAREMGTAENETRGMSALENVMLDLALVDGAIKTSGSPQAGEVQVGPTSTRTVIVDPRRIGVGSTYFSPQGKFYVPQVLGTQQVATATAGHAAANTSDPQLPDLIDAWGQPLLAWVEDETAIREVDGNNVFLCLSNSGNGTGIAQSAKFYWASNAAFLKATALGRKGLDQRRTGSSDAYSLIGENAPGIPGSNAAYAKSLEGFLGNPNAPYRDPSGGNNLASVYAGAGRTRFLLHSAGPDGYYLGTKDRGGRVYASNGILDYTWSQFNVATNQPHTDRNGNPTNEDLVKLFDDLIATGSN